MGAYMRITTLIALISMLSIHSTNAGIFNIVTNIENNTDTDYYGGNRTISAHKHSYAINILGLPVTLKPKNEPTKPTFVIEQVAADKQSRSCPWLTSSRTYGATGSNNTTTQYTACIGLFKRANIYVIINKDYSISITATTEK